MTLRPHVPRQEPVPPSFRLLSCAPLGAVLGFACAVLVGVGVEPLGRGETVVSSTRWWSAAHEAWPWGAVLGALYLPLACALLANRSNLVNATIVASIAAVIFGIIGDAGVLDAPPALSASLGFWVAIFGIYGYGRRERKGGGFGGYYS